MRALSAVIPLTGFCIRTGFHLLMLGHSAAINLSLECPIPSVRASLTFKKRKEKSGEEIDPTISWRYPDI